MTHESEKRIEAKLETYENFIEEKLKRDLKDIEAVLFKKNETHRSLQELRGFVRHVRSRKRDEPTATFDFGFGVHAMALLGDVDRLLVNVGCDCYLEMRADEADKYADIRLKYLNKEIDFFRQQAVHVKAHIKLVALAMNELKSSDE